MNVNTPAADEGLRAALALGNVPAGLGEPPQGSAMPFYIVYPMASPDLAGSFGEPLDMGDLVYQVTCVGTNYTQAVRAEERAIATLRQQWHTIPGCCGLPVVSRRGTMRAEDNLWQAILVITVKVSAA